MEPAVPDLAAKDLAAKDLAAKDLATQDPAAACTGPARAGIRAGRHSVIAARLREDILYCRWFAGQWLKQAELEAEYGASRSEIRAALTEMRRLGLVRHELNRGYRVEAADATRRSEIRAARAALEGASVNGIIAQAGEADIARLRDLATLFTVRAGESPLRELIAINHEFHAALYALCGNAFLAGLIGELREREMAASIGRWTTPHGLLATAREHLAMVEAIAARDAAALRRLVTAHLHAF